jgi:hypothetical protein
MTTRTILLRTCLAILVSVAMLASLSPMGSVAASDPAAHTPQHGSKVLFEANWTTMRNKLQGIADFTVDHNRVIVTGDPDERLQMPFSTRGLKNFAVEATIAAATPTLPTFHYFGLFVRGAFGNTANAVALLYSHDASRADDGSLLLWGGDKDHLLPGARFPLDTAFHRYRAEVQGAHYRLLIDGTEIIPWTVVSTRGIGDRLGIMGAYTPLTIRSYRVLTLAPALPKVSQDTRGWDAHVLTEDDVQMPTQYGLFHNNLIAAGETNGTPATVDTTGRILGYTVLFADSRSIVEDKLTLYSSSDMARAAFQSSVIMAQREHSTLPGYHEIDTSSLGIGSESIAYSYEHDNNGQVAYRVVTLFHHGAYVASVTTDARTDSGARISVTLAQKADSYIGHPHSVR